MNATTKTLSNGLHIEIKNTIRLQMRRDVFYNRFVAGVQGLTPLERSFRNMFCWIAAHTTSVVGMDWQAVTENSTDEEWHQAFESWTDAVDEMVADEWYKAIETLSLPLSAREEQPQPEPTDQMEAAADEDPNSGHVAKPLSKKSSKTSDV